MSKFVYLKNSLIGILLIIPRISFSQGEPLHRLGINWGVLPITQFSSDQGLTLGLQSRRFDYGHSGTLPFVNLLTLQSSYSTLGPTGGLGSFELTGLGDKNMRAYFGISGFHTPYQKYYGLGDQTPFDSQLNSKSYYTYTSDNYLIESSARMKFESGFELKTGITLSYYRFTPNNLDSQYGKDFGTTPNSGLYTKIQVGALTDKRNFEFVPSEGYYAALLLNFSPSFLGTTSTWFRGDLDIRYYLSIISDRWLWLAAQFLLSESSAHAPLTEKVRLGSQGTLRGLPLNRYLSNFSSTQRLDLRSMFFRQSLFNKPLKAGLGTFVDTGHIGDTFPRLFQTRTQIAVGMSLFGSYFMDDFICNADVGFSQGGRFIYAGLGHAF